MRMQSVSCEEINSRPALLIKMTVFLLVTFTGFGKCDGKTTSGPGQTYDCNGGVWVALNKTRGLVRSPNYPQLFPTHSCSQWTIYSYGLPGNVITISFEDLDIPASKDCKDSYVKIGPTPERVYCGKINTTSPEVYVSQRNHVWIQFVSNSWDSGRGFSFTYLIGGNVTKGCLADEFRCSYGKCILLKWQCNGASECEDSSDEVGCTSKKQLTTPGPLACGEANFGCFDVVTHAYRCFLNNKLCDNHVDCLDAIDERNCDGKNCTYHLEGPYGFFHSPNYPKYYGNEGHCSWHVHVRNGSIIQLRFLDFSLQVTSQTDYLRIYDGPSASHPLIGTFYGGHKPAHIMVSTTNRLYLEFTSDAAVTSRGFNVSYQIKGECMSDQRPCGHGELDCYEVDQRCDQVWDCPAHGGDERGCGQCSSNYFQCGKDSTQCYTEAERCNGQIHCTTHKADEANCTPEQCGAHNGTFLCQNKLCIYESWLCDGQDDCKDLSDEIDCSRPSVKVITAAVIGSLICGLLLVVALGCTCKLYALRMQEHAYPVSTPSVHEHAAMLARLFAPPPYPEAMATSRNYDEVRQEILRRERRRRGRGRSRRHRRTVSVQQQTGDDDVALLNIDGDSEDVACIDIGDPQSEDQTTLDDSESDSECDNTDLVEINPAGAQWHRTLPKPTVMLVPPAPLQLADCSPNPTLPPAVSCTPDSSQTHSTDSEQTIPPTQCSARTAPNTSQTQTTEHDAVLLNVNTNDDSRHVSSPESSTMVDTLPSTNESTPANHDFLGTKSVDMSNREHTCTDYNLSSTNERLISTPSDNDIVADSSVSADLDSG